MQHCEADIARHLCCASYVDMTLLVVLMMGTEYSLLPISLIRLSMHMRARMLGLALQEQQRKHDPA